VVVNKQKDYCFLALVFLTFLSLPAANSKTLTLLSENGPPHMIEESDSGIDLDITIAVLEHMGHEVRVLYSPLTRAKREVIKGNFDVTVPTFFTEDQDNFYLSTPVIPYQPMIFSTKPLALSTLSDIRGLRVSTFQGATGYFGSEFVKMTQQNDYQELSNMYVLPDLLHMSRTDIVVLDYYIFHYFALQHELDFQQTGLHEYKLIPAVKASVGFNNSELRDKFNLAYEELLKQGKINQILKRYMGKSHSPN
jgi:ABC-type amino acid transport substrate-binding protein